ncbi:MAG: hypothetical protein LKJ75_05075 [Clostridia bacterium]|jgi:hypothetical protein|nr:hypothetical protein [Clostridia bacterium]MCI2014555.1 hypothetical protein [Clostridia bacterium]
MGWILIGIIVIAVIKIKEWSQPTLPPKDMNSPTYGTLNDPENIAYNKRKAGLINQKEYKKNMMNGRYR